MVWCSTATSRSICSTKYASLELMRTLAVAQPAVQAPGEAGRLCSEWARAAACPDSFLLPPPSPPRGSLAALAWRIFSLHRSLGCGAALGKAGGCKDVSARPTASLDLSRLPPPSPPRGSLAMLAWCIFSLHRSLGCGAAPGKAGGCEDVSARPTASLDLSRLPPPSPPRSPRKVADFVGWVRGSLAALARISFSRLFALLPLPRHGLRTTYACLGIWMEARHA